MVADNKVTTIEMNQNQPLLKNGGVFKPFIVSLRDCFSDEELPDIKLKVIQGQNASKEGQVSVDQYCSFLYREVDYNSTQEAWMLCTGDGTYMHPWEPLSIYEENLRKNPRIVKAPKVDATTSPDKQLDANYKLWNFVTFAARGMCRWSFLCLFVVTVCMMCTFVLDIVATTYVTVTDPELSSLVRYSYALSATAIAATVIYFFALWMLLQSEIYNAFTLENFNCPTLAMYMPVTMSRVSKSADFFRVGIAFVWCLIATVLVGVDFYADLPIKGTFADNEGGSLISNFLGAFGLVIGAILSLIYTVAAVGVDCYGIYKVLHDGCYLTQYLDWVPFNPDINYTRTSWFFWTRATVPEDLRNNFSICRFIPWVLTHSWVPWLIVIWPIFNIWVLRYGMSTRGVIVFTFYPFIIFFVQSLRHYRLRCHKFSDRDDHEDKRRVEDRNALVNFFLLISFLLAVAFVAISMQTTMLSYENQRASQGGETAVYVTKNPGSYPVCESQFFNHEMPIAQDNIIDSVDVMAFTSAIYFAQSDQEDKLDRVGVNKFLKDYFGDKFCDKNDFSKCDRDDQWRVIYESYEVDPVFFHAYLPSNKFHIVSLRGTASIRDALMDMILWCEISVLQQIAGIFPVFKIWTVDMIQSIINLGSTMHKVVSKGKVADYYESPLKYLQENKIPNNSNREYLMIAGHSLGGGVAQIVAARLYDTQSKRVMAFNLAGPGIAFSANKFGVTADALKFTGFTVHSIGDPVAAVDQQKGTVNEIDCDSPIRTTCHYQVQMQCELANSCYNEEEIASMSESKATYLHGKCPTGFLSDKRLKALNKAPKVVEN